MWKGVSSLLPTFSSVWHCELHTSHELIQTTDSYYSPVFYAYILITNYEDTSSSSAEAQPLFPCLQTANRKEGHNDNGAASNQHRRERSSLATMRTSQLIDLKCEEITVGMRRRMAARRRWKNCGIHRVCLLQRSHCCRQCLAVTGRPLLRVHGQWYSFVYENGARHRERMKNALFERNLGRYALPHWKDADTKAHEFRINTRLASP
jgi:hypothetical protein